MLPLNTMLAELWWTASDSNRDPLIAGQGCCRYHQQPPGIWSGMMDLNHRSPASKAGGDDQTPLIPVGRLRRRVWRRTTAGTVSGAGRSCEVRHVERIALDPAPAQAYHGRVT